MERRGGPGIDEAEGIRTSTHARPCSPYIHCSSARQSQSWQGTGTPDIQRAIVAHLAFPRGMACKRNHTSGPKQGEGGLLAHSPPLLLLPLPPAYLSCRVIAFSHAPSARTPSRVLLWPFPRQFSRLSFRFFACFALTCRRHLPLFPSRRTPSLPLCSLPHQFRPPPPPSRLPPSPSPSSQYPSLTPSSRRQSAASLVPSPSAPSVLPLARPSASRPPRPPLRPRRSPRLTPLLDQWLRPCRSHMPTDG